MKLGCMLFCLNDFEPNGLALFFEKCESSITESNWLCLQLGFNEMSIRQRNMPAMEELEKLETRNH